MTKQYFYLEMAEVECERSFLAYATAMENAELNRQAGELQCLMETGDLQELSEYSFFESDDKISGLLKNIWTKIKNLFKRIKEIFFGKKIKVKAPKNTKVETSGPLAFVIRNLKGAWSRVKSIVILGKQKLSENGNWKKLLAVLGVAVAGVTLASVFKNKSGNGKVTTVAKSPKIATKESPSENVVTIQQTEEALETCKDITETVVKVAEKNEKQENSDPDNARQLQTLEQFLRPHMKGMYQIEKKYELMVIPGNEQSEGEKQVSERPKKPEKPKSARRKAAEDKLAYAAMGGDDEYTRRSSKGIYDYIPDKRQLSDRAVVVSPNGEAFAPVTASDRHFNTALSDKVFTDRMLKKSYRKLIRIADKALKNASMLTMTKDRCNTEFNEIKKIAKTDENKAKLQIVDFLLRIANIDSQMIHLMNIFESVLSDADFDAFLESGFSTEWARDYMEDAYENNIIDSHTYNYYMEHIANEY